jgi:hypothetical protein
MKILTKTRSTWIGIGLVTTSFLTGCDSTPAPFDEPFNSPRPSATADDQGMTQSLFEYQAKHVSSSGYPTVIAQETGEGDADVKLASTSDKPLVVSVTFNCFGTGSMKIQTEAVPPEFAEGTCLHEANSAPALYDVVFKKTMDLSDAKNLRITTTGKVAYFVTVSTE